jgi:hypothetical protein
MFHDTWRELAEKASKEEDPERLIALVKELNGILSQPEAAAQHRKSKTTN